MNEAKIDPFAEKRMNALAYLGENWVLHPNYKPNPKHSLVGSTTLKLRAYQTPHSMKEAQT